MFLFLLKQQFIFKYNWFVNLKRGEPYGALKMMFTAKNTGSQGFYLIDLFLMSRLSTGLKQYFNYKSAANSVGVL